MTFDKKALRIFGINCAAWSLREDGDQDVGNMFSNALTFDGFQMEPAQSGIKSLRKLDVDIYEGVGKIIILNNYGNYPKLLFDCGIYAFSTHTRLPEGIEDGSYVKMQFYLDFDDGEVGEISMNGKSLSMAVPEMIYDWKVKDILVWARDGEKGEKYFEDLPVAYTTPEGEIYKRVKGTDAYNQTGRYPINTRYILICEML